MKSLSVRLLFGFFSFLLFSFGLGGALQMLRAYIIADEEGLRWRGIGRQRVARWEDVTDFYTRSISSTQSQCRVETRAGNFSFSFAFKGARELSLAIAQRAAPVEGLAARTRQWREDGEWPHVFSYRTVENRLLPPVMLLAILAWLALSWLDTPRPTPGAILLVLRDIATQLPLPLLALGAVFLAAFAFGLPLLFIVVMAQVGRDARRDERLIVTSRGVLFQNGAQWIEAPWEALRAFKAEYVGRFLKTPRYILETAAGSIVWSSNLGDQQFLMTLIPASSPALFEAENEAGENLAPHLTEKNGARIFHFRTRTNRALLWLVTVVCLLPLLAPLLRSASGEPAQPVSQPAWIFYGCAAVALAVATLGWLFYFRTLLRVDERGLEQVTPLSRKFIAWPDVREFFKHKDDEYCVRSENATIRIRYYFAPANLSQLREEIARRAVNSRNKEWQTR